jgi:NAD(P)H-hydrate epimerase
MDFPILKSAPPHVDTPQMIEVDRLMVEEYHIDLVQMMENAGRNLARLAVNRFLQNGANRVVIMAGTGGNGGGALVAARHLHNWGKSVRVILTRSQQLFKGVPAHQVEILQNMRVTTYTFTDTRNISVPDLIIDGLIGYSLKGSPSGKAAELIRWANLQKVTVLSLDIPSGLDASTGIAHEPVINATATMTLALPKKGFLTPGAKSLIGELYLADIGVPPELYAKPSLNLDMEPLFSSGEILRLAL